MSAASSAIAAAMRAAPPPTLEYLHACAARYAAAWRADCYVYLRDSGVIFSWGPDANHPKTAPDFIEAHPLRKGENK